LEEDDSPSKKEKKRIDDCVDVLMCVDIRIREVRVSRGERTQTQQKKPFREKKTNLF
jgi:hypothetical protein